MVFVLSVFTPFEVDFKGQFYHTQTPPSIQIKNAAHSLLILLAIPLFSGWHLGFSPFGESGWSHLTAPFGPSYYN